MSPPAGRSRPTGRAKTTRLLTLDERHFRAMQPLWGEAFLLLPADG